MKQQNIMETKLARIAEISKEKPQEIFTSIYHFLNKDLLMLCHKELDGKKATGLDVNDNIRMYKKWNLYMYKNKHL